jgi:hypothetical protein
MKNNIDIKIEKKAEEIIAERKKLYVVKFK